MRADGRRIALLWGVLLLTVVAVVESHNGKSKWPGVSDRQWKGLSYFLKKLPQKQFFGMEFVLNVTGERCTPQWCLPKPPCWNPGWPWPWPGHAHKRTIWCPGGSTVRPTTRKTSTVTTRRPQETTTTSRTTRTTTAASTTTTTTTASTTTQGVESTTFCPYTPDGADDAWCTPIVNAQKRTGPLADCGKYYSNETLEQFFQDCRRCNCRYQRHYICQCLAVFVTNCSNYLQADESMYGWRHITNCPENSTPYPTNFNFTDLPSSTTPMASGKRKRDAGDSDDVEENDDDANGKAVSDGTERVAFGIRNNWCVPRIFSWWWKKRGGNWPGRSSEDDGSWGNGGGDNSNDDDGSWGNGGNSNDDDDSNDSDNSNGGGGGKGNDDSKDGDSDDDKSSGGRGGGGKGHGSGKGGKGGKGGGKGRPGKGNGGGKGHNNNNGKGGKNHGKNVNKDNWRDVWSGGKNKKARDDGGAVEEEQENFVVDESQQQPNDDSGPENDRPWSS